MQQTTTTTSTRNRKFKSIHDHSTYSRPTITKTTIQIVAMTLMLMAIIPTRNGTAVRTASALLVSPLKISRLSSSSYQGASRRYFCLSKERRSRMGTKISSSPEPQSTSNMPEIPRYLNEGIFAVSKPLEWTSQDVVGFLRKMLERDAKERGCVDERKRRKKPWMTVGHGGTLDPLATGVLIVGVGKGTKELQKYLTGPKGYRAGVELGYQTTTLDLDPNGSVVENKPYDHVTKESIENILVQFRGNIQQIPPVFSALKKNGKKLYELGRQGQTAEDVQIEPRQVQIHRLELLPPDDTDNDEEDETKRLPPHFKIDVECGGGTYIRSLVRDIGLALDTVATMTSLERTKQGVFLPEHCLHQEDWTPENIYSSIEESKVLLVEQSQLHEDSAKLASD